jgi:glutathione S-transferase
LTKAGVYPKTLWEMIEERAPNFVEWSEAVSAHPSVLCKYDEKEIVEATKAKLAQMRGEA